VTASPAPTVAASHETRRDGVAAVLVLAWLVGATLAGHYGVWLSLGSVAVFCGALLLAFEPRRLLPLLRPTGGWIALGAAVGVAMVLATGALYPVAVGLVPSVAVQTARLYAAFHALSRAAAMAALVPVVVGEEVVWRGAVYGVLVRRWGTPSAIGLGTLIYAAAHAPVGSPLLVLTAAACGLVWSLLRAATRSLVPTLVCHVVWDAMVLLVWPLASS